MYFLAAVHILIQYGISKSSKTIREVTSYIFSKNFMKILFGEGFDVKKLIYTKVASSDFDHAPVLSDQHTV